MDVITETELTTVDGDGARNVTEGDAGWSLDVCQSTARIHVEALLNFSEESSALDDGPFEMFVDSGWEEAIKGWGRCSPLAGIFQTQTNFWKAKSGDKDYHCILCKDVKLSEDSKHSQSIGEATDILGKNRETSPRLTYTHSLPMQCPVMKEKIRDETLTINNFAILPPVRAAGQSNFKTPSILEKSEGGISTSTVNTVATEVGSLGMSETDRRGVGGGQPIAPNTHSDEEVPEDGKGPLTPKYWHSPSSSHLLSAVNIYKPTKTLPLATYPMGRTLKQNDLSRLANKSNRSQRLYAGLKSNNVKQTQPQLPMLFGTRILIPASSHH